MPQPKGILNVQMTESPVEERNAYTGDATRVIATSPLEETPPIRRRSYPSRAQSGKAPPANPPLALSDTRVTGKATVMERVKTQAVSLLTAPRPLPEPPSLKASLMNVVKASWLNVLLVCIPIGWAMHFANLSPVIVFVFTFLAIIPLAKLLAFATEELAMRVGQTLGGLLNATLGNAVELIVAIIALIQCKLTIVQSSLVGSILSNLLLVLGMCFFAGGTRYSEQGFLVTPAQMNSTLLVLSVIAVLLPAAFHMAITSSNNADSNTSDDFPEAEQASDILKMSHGVAVILLIIYGCHLVFTLWSHAHVMNEAPSPSTRYPENVNLRNQFTKVADHFHRQSHEHEREGEDGATAVARSDPADVEKQEEVPEEADEPEVPTISFPVCLGLMAVVTVLVGVTAEFLVDSIDGVTATGGISEEWVGLILLPIVGNAAEHVTAVTVSVKNKLDLSIGVAVGSSIQIALFVIPFITVLAWIMGKPLTMLFDPFESVVLFLAVLTVNYVVADGKSNWLEGMILMNLYAIVAVSFWFYPGFNPSTSLGLICS